MKPTIPFTVGRDQQVFLHAGRLLELRYLEHAGYQIAERSVDTPESLVSVALLDEAIELLKKGEEGSGTCVHCGGAWSDWGENSDEVYHYANPEDDCPVTLFLKKVEALKGDQ